MDDTPILYMLVTNDRFELPLCVCESSAELSRYLGFAQGTRTASRLSQSPDGMVQTMDRKYKYMRLDPRTGEIYIGKLPAKVAGYCLSTGHRAVIGRKDGVERLYPSVKDAVKETGCAASTIYACLRSGRPLKGYVWRYA